MATDTFGQVFVSQQLFVSLSLFFLKEAFRKEGQRSDLSQGFACTGAASTCLLSIMLSFVWYVWLGTNFSVVLLLLIAVSIEAFAEPFLYLRLREGDYACKTSAETVSNFIRSVTLAGIVYSGRFENLAFAAAQVVYSVVWLFMIFQKNQGTKLVITTQLPAGFTVLLGLTCLKLILTEIEKFILLAFFDAQAWAQFGLVSNFGSLILRTFFAPIEDVAFSAFSRKDFSALAPIFFLQTSLGLAAACFGPSVAEEAVLVLYGRQWASQPGIAALLAWYCVLLFLCAVNGITEAHFFATADARTLKRAGWRQAAAAAVQICLGAGLVRLGPLALILGNAAGMLVRIIGCWAPVFSEILISRRWEYCSLLIGGAATTMVVGLPQASRLSAVVAVAAVAVLPAARGILSDF